ncbi:trypsin-like serine peptidase [Streptomyces chattanoogensis]|uniref:trypsin-like serine peptidase n=1 Tax=Streptomyces chattanoogensis TaxID=66876 RepID=UPI0006B610BC|nr:trypsin-like serine protease [Streptomyces chattanoogensis]
MIKHHISPRPARRASRALLVVLVPLLAAALSGCAARTPPPEPRGLPFVGVLTSDNDHWCTASVVDSPRRNLIATAAHCVYFHKEDEKDGYEAGPFKGDLRFAPQFSGAAPGHYPYGTWKVTGIHVHTLWTKENDDRGDYAFLTVAPDKKGRRLQDVVGAAAPDWSSSPHRRVTVVGYPNEDHNPRNRPVSCTTRTRRDPDEPYMVRIECPGFWPGTSGGPWLADHRDAARPGRLMGVLSGGDTDRESVAVLFDRRARALYERAARG